jgi:hypothetical protein
MRLNRFATCAGTLGLSVAFAVQSASAADTKFGPAPQQFTDSRQRGVDFLKTVQSNDGTWTSNTSSGVTALAVTALVQSGLTTSDPVVAKGLKALEKFVQKDGGIYHPNTTHKNWLTATADTTRRWPGPTSSCAGCNGTKKKGSTSLTCVTAGPTTVRRRSGPIFQTLNSSSKR